MNTPGITTTIQTGSAEPLVLLATLVTVALAVQAGGALLTGRVPRVLAATPWSFALGSLAALASAVLWGDLAPVAFRISLDGFETPHAVSLGWGLDRLGAAMVALVGFLGAIIFRYSTTYLKSEEARPRFLRWLIATVTSVQLFALSTSLIGHAILWLFISISVSRLLLHYSERPRARIAAKKKFLTSRLADGAFWASLAVLFAQQGTLDIGELSQNAAQGIPSVIAVAGICLAVLIKSAQFPFHSWLPETMDAPTPVSAVMHAGVVNAGAFLLLRITPLLELSSVALLLLTVCGGVTATVGMLMGTLQPSVKLRLAYSTVAQMGFLFFELGLGLVGAAALHLAAHALYKAHAFLRAGTHQARVKPTPYSVGGVTTAMLASLVVFTGVLGLASFTIGGRVIDYLPLSVVWALGASQYLLSPSQGPLLSRMRAFFLAGLGVWGIALVGEVALSTWFTALPSPLSFGLSGVLLTSLTIALLAVTTIVCSRADFHGPRLEKLYVYALSGFYIGELTDRITLALWPDRALTSLSSKVAQV